MKKTSKRVISLLLTLTLMFSAVMMFPSSVSALVKRTGVVQSGLLAGRYEKFEVFGYFVFCQHWGHCHDEISCYGGLNCACLCGI